MLLSNRLTASILAPTRRLALLAAHRRPTTPLSARNLTMSSATPYSRLIRFHPYITHKFEFGKSDVLDVIKIGEPVDPSLDVGGLMYRGFPGDPTILINVYSGTSILSPGEPTGEQLVLGQLLSPLSQAEVGTIRCIGLNYAAHAAEANLPLPTVPTLFMKPSTALAGPYPQPTVIPRSFVDDDAADWEAEVAVIIGKLCKDVSETDALDYVLGITAANDVSSRKAQFAQSQWCYSKGFDGACPIGPAVVPLNKIPELGEVKIQAKLNKEVVQESDLKDLIFSIPKIVSFLSKGTTLLPGTLILTGTPAGIGWTASPRKTLKHGDVFAVTLSHGVGSLINDIKHEE